MRFSRAEASAARQARCEAIASASDVSGISLGMYSVFTVGVSCWLVYGLLLGAWPIIIANAITLTGGRIQASYTANAPGTLTTAQLTAQSGTIAAVITGTDFVKSGTGVLILDAENTYTGSTTVTGGTLQPGSLAAIPAESVVNVNGGAFDLNGLAFENAFVVAGGALTNGVVNLSQLTATTGVVSATIDGDLGFAKATAGTLTLSGANTFTGGVAISAGTLQLGSTDALGANLVTVTGGTLNLGQQAIANAIVLDAGTLANGTLALGQLTANAGTVSAVLTGTGGFVRNGTGVLTLAGANTFTGGVTVTAGTLAAGSTGAFGANAVTINGGVLDLGQQTLANSFILNGGSLVNGTLALGKVTANAGNLGAVLTGLMVLLFLRDWRSAFIVVVNIPIALLAATFALWITGQSLNLMTLSGLALAVGILVDEATVAVENIHAHLARGTPLARAALEATRETALPRLLAMLCIVAVFIPAFFMVGAAKALFTPLALAVGFSMIASFFLSSTLVPVLSVWFLRRHPAPISSTSTPPLPLARFYASLVRPFIAARWLVLPLYLAAAFGLISVFGPQLGLEIFPAVDSGQLAIRFRGAAGTKVEKTEAVAKQILDTINREAGAANVAITIGLVGVHASNYPVNLIYLFNTGPEEGWLAVQLKPGSGVKIETLKEKLRAAFAASTLNRIGSFAARAKTANANAVH